MSARSPNPSRIPELWIRTTAGPSIGYGHLRRSLTLAGLVADSMAPVFLLDPEDTRSHELVSAKGWKILSYPESRLHPERRHPDVFLADARVIDGLADFVLVLKGLGVPAVSIHDLGLSILPSDILIDGSMCPTRPAAVPGGTRLLTGPEYQILDSSFSRASRAASPQPEQVDTIHIALGGGDHRRLLEPVLEGIRRSGRSVQITALPGFVDSNTQAFDGCNPSPLQFRWARASEEPADLLAAADLAITAGGVTAFEALCVGTPLMAVAHDAYQLQTLRAFESRGACLCLGCEPDPARISGDLVRVCSDRAARESMAANGKALVDGLGAVRVAGLLEALADGRDAPAELGAIA